MILLLASMDMPSASIVSIPMIHCAFRPSTIIHGLQHLLDPIFMGRIVWPFTSNFPPFAVFNLVPKAVILGVFIIIKYTFQATIVTPAPESNSASTSNLLIADLNPRPWAVVLWSSILVIAPASQCGANRGPHSSKNFAEGRNRVGVPPLVQFPDSLANSS